MNKFFGSRKPELVQGFFLKVSIQPFGSLNLNKLRHPAIFSMKFRGEEGQELKVNFVAELAKVRDILANSATLPFCIPMVFFYEMSVSL